EMKWKKEPLGPGDVAQHLVRVFSREGSVGLFISASPYTAGAIQSCRDSLGQLTVVLCTLEEIVLLVERNIDLREFLQKKVNAVVMDKNPFHQPIAAGEFDP